MDAIADLLSKFVIAEAKNKFSQVLHTVIAVNTTN